MSDPKDREQEVPPPPIAAGEPEAAKSETRIEHPAKSDSAVDEPAPPALRDPKDRPLRLVVCYTPVKYTYAAELIDHLRTSARIDTAAVLRTDRAGVGGEWRQLLTEALEQADMALLFLSEAFLASEFLRDLAVLQCFHEHETRGLQVVPVMLQSCLWEAHPWLVTMKPLLHGYPISVLLDRDVSSGVLRFVEEIWERAGDNRAAIVDTSGAVRAIPESAPSGVTFDTRVEHSTVASLAVGDGSVASGSMSMHGVTVHAETVIFAGAATPGTAVGRAPASTSRSRPNYPDTQTQFLSESLGAAKARRQRLREHGRATTDLDREVLDLKRQLREGGQLRAGDSLGANDRYELLDLLGRGGFASVWLAYDNQRGSNVAIKVLHSNLAGDRVRLDRFKRGARIMADLQHEAVVRVLEPYGEDGGWHYFIMEHLPGGDLRRAALESRIKQSDVLPAMLEVCGAVALTHSRRILHRDIKPANILLDEHGRAKLTDFDLVAAPDTTGGTRTGAVGTVVYTAPEVLDGSMEASAASDVYSLAMTALFGLCGADLPTDVLRDPNSVFEPLFVAEPVKAEVLRALDWDPWRRHQNAGQLRDALSTAISHAGGPGMAARREEYEHVADEPIYAALFSEAHEIDNPPPGLSYVIEYKRYYNSRFGFAVDVPTFLVPQPGPANGDGRRFAFRKAVEMTASGMWQWDEHATARSLFQEEVDRVAKRTFSTVLDGTVDQGSYMMKTRDGEDITLHKTTLANGVTSGVYFKYPAAQDHYFDPVARRVLASFRPPERPDPRQE